MDLNLNKLSNKQLEFIYSRFVAPDKNTFNIKVVGAGFNEYITNKIVDFILNNCTAFSSTSTIAVLNDFSFHITKALMSAGIPAKNIKLLFFKKDKTNLIDDSLNNFFKLHPVIRQNKDLQIITFKELQNMKIDGIIANPPYGAIGANITKKIIDTVDYQEYINLLPANDYKRNKDKDLFNYQSDMSVVVEAGGRAFADAAVTTHVARIHKDKVNNMTLDEFERSNYIDRQLDKYFAENSNRSHYAIDTAVTNESVSSVAALNNTNTFMIGERDVNHKALSATGITYEWNILKTIDGNKVLDSIGRSSGGKKIHFGFIKFKTTLEAKNFTSFMYDNSSFITKVFTALNVDGSIDICKWAPKIDWTRSWTVEEILADYGYDADEIKAVMDDLKNFKGMDD